MSALIRAENLAVGYGRTVILSGIDLTVRRGERWFLLGPNGGGKTTLLRGLLGSLPPRAGRVTRQCSVSYVSQFSEVAPLLSLTVGELVQLGLVGTQERRTTLAATLAQVGLGGSEGRDFFGLSGGQRRRALLARALMRRPDILALDEPTANVDEKGEEAFFALLEGQRELTLLVATHRRWAAERFGTHLVRIEDGRVEVEARP